MKASNARTGLFDLEVEEAKHNQEETGVFDDYDDRTRQVEAVREAETFVEACLVDLHGRLSLDLPTRRKVRDTNRQRRDRSVAAELIDSLGLVLDAFLFDVIEGSVDEISEPLNLAVANLLEGGLTTNYAIALLLKEGYVVDADARWRGLYEIACQAAILAKASAPSEAALRFLMHGQGDRSTWRLRAPDRLAGEAIVEEELMRGRPQPDSQTGVQGVHFWYKSHQWIPAHLLAGELPQKQISQADLFRIADLAAAPRDLVDESHQSVHMSTPVLAADRAVARGLNPGGYDQSLEEDIASRTAMVVYELVANCCLLATYWRQDVIFPGWERVFYDYALRIVEETGEPG